MDLVTAFRLHEEALISTLRLKQAGIDDATGKGTSTEMVIEEQLLRPYLAPGFDCVKGAIVNGPSATEQSPAYDRVIYSRDYGAPLLYDDAHTIFAVEVVAGVVEITMQLNTSKLRTDISRIKNAREMKVRRFWVPELDENGKPHVNKVVKVTEPDCIRPRAFVIGLPSDPNWGINTIAESFADIMKELGTDIGGLYVLGRAYFQVVPGAPPKPDGRLPLLVSAGDDRLFRFVTDFRRAWDRWPKIEGRLVRTEKYMANSAVPM